VPRAESRGDHDVVNDVVDDPFDLWGLEEENDFSRSQVRGVPVEAEFLEVERRARGDEVLGLLLGSFPQTGNDHQAIH
jgi:hypothetical protein